MTTQEWGKEENVWQEGLVLTSLRIHSPSGECWHTISETGKLSV